MSHLGIQAVLRRVCTLLQEETNSFLKAIEEANKKMEAAELSLEEKDQKIGELDRLIERMEKVTDAAGNYCLLVSVVMAIEPMALCVVGKPLATNLSGQARHNYFDTFKKHQHL